MSLRETTICKQEHYAHLMLRSLFPGINYRLGGYLFQAKNGAFKFPTEPKDGQLVLYVQLQG